MSTRVSNGATDLARVDEQLLRHAASDHARASPPSCLGNRDLGAVFGGYARRSHAARTSSDHEQIDIEARHEVCSVRVLQYSRITSCQAKTIGKQNSCSIKV